MKSSNLFLFWKKCTPYDQILIFKEQLQYVCLIWICIFDTDQSQKNLQYITVCTNQKAFNIGTQRLFCFLFDSLCCLVTMQGLKGGRKACLPVFSLPLLSR